MFDIKEIERIAGLARLQLTADEKSALAEQFESILNYFKKIESVPLPESNPGESGSISAHLRPDASEPSGIAPDTFSPYLESGHFKVPKIIE